MCECVNLFGVLTVPKSANVYFLDMRGFYFMLGI